jgi:hypothetical protein
MKSAHLLSLAIAISSAVGTGWAAQHDQSTAQRPAGAAAAPGSAGMPGMPGATMPGMDAQIRAMRQMHDKMMAAKTPEERNALMAEHMKTMQDGMKMMNDMPSGGSVPMQGGMMGDMAMRHQMMEKRMEMMSAAMQMMMDRLPAAPAK